MKRDEVRSPATFSIFAGAIFGLVVAVSCGGGNSTGAGGMSGGAGTNSAGGTTGTGGASGAGAGSTGTGGPATGDGGAAGVGTGGSAGTGGTGGSAGTGGDAGTGVPKSCRELYARGVRADGQYQIDPDGPGGTPAFTTACEMNTEDQMGWTLMAKVNTATVNMVDEPRPWFVSESHPEMLMSRTFVDNQPPASHGAYKFVPLLSASSIARFEIYAQLDVTQKASWYKVVASAASLQGWFTPNDTTPSRVCTNLALTLNCSDGKIAPHSDEAVTFLDGMQLNPYGYTADTPIHMRLNDDDIPENSGVCSATLDRDNNKWKDSYNTHWGNGLLIWIN
jgi:hypothetical protein